MQGQDVQGKIQRLQELEQDLEGLSQQREAMQSQIVEVESALDELDEKEEAYKIIGNVMVKRDAESLQGELAAELDSLEERFDEVSEEHEQVEDDASSLRKEVMESMQG